MKKRKGFVKPDGTVSTLVLITQIGIGMMTPIALCAVAGYFIGKWTGLEAPVFIVLMFFGIAVGYRNVWVMVRKYTKDDVPEPVVPEHLSEAETEFRKWKEEKKSADGSGR
ncbi:MAG: AtpZ/AtpI family protein [Lachnospiraceae bacterium]|nr:AtpZ/AtpI family protein [Lachnospiraceae bacterium]